MRNPLPPSSFAFPAIFFRKPKKATGCSAATWAFLFFTTQKKPLLPIPGSKGFFIIRQEACQNIYLTPNCICHTLFSEISSEVAFVGSAPLTALKR